MLLPTSARHGLQPRDAVAGLEARPHLGVGPGERYTGYAVFGVTFQSGDILALRRFAATSVGPAYTSVWHRSPDGRWTMYQDLQKDAGCGRYFSAAASIVTARIRVVWSGADRFGVCVDAETPLAWKVSLGSTGVTRAITRLASTDLSSTLPAPRFARACSLAAGALLRSGALTLLGVTPNGFRFEARPSGLWVVNGSQAFINGRSLGRPVPRASSIRIGTFEIPRRGLFATMHAILRRST
jgi:hypothetical protein